LLGLGDCQVGAIQGLDYVEPSLGITLHQAVMDICSQENGSPLFITVNKETWSLRITFLFPEDQMEEAVTLVPALPIIMVAKYGPHAWSWFNEDGKSEMAGWLYDQKIGVICLEEDKQTTDIVQEYDGNSDSNDEDMCVPAIGVKMDLALLSEGIKGCLGSTTYSDNGTINTQGLKAPGLAGTNTTFISSITKDAHSDDNSDEEATATSLASG
jgi:basic membrane lipoprotein Med (substrate-binding protein (PBP1-ABC) superfamily)